MSKKKQVGQQVEAFDIETFYTYDGPATPANINNECKKKTVVNVCSIAYTKDDENIYHLGTLGQREFLDNMPAGVYATWNGARFDNHCMIYLLHIYGFTYKYMYQKKNSMLQLKFLNKNGWVVFKDYCKIYSMSLEKLLKELAPEVPKLSGEYDYSLERYRKEDFNEIDIQYIINDVRGLKIAVNKLDRQVESLGLDPSKIITAGGLATKYVKQDLKRKGLDPGDLFVNNDLVDYSFVAGGIVQVHPAHRFKTFERVHHYDIVSFYPYVMSLPLPFGEAVEIFECNVEKLIEIVNNDNEHLYFAKVNCEGYYKALVSPIFAKNRLGINESLTAWEVGEEIPIPDPVLRSPRLRLYNGVARVAKYKKLTYLKGTVNTVFRKKSEAKEAGNSGLALTYKIIVNSLSGKFMQKPIDTEYRYIHNEGVFEEEVVDKRVPWHVYLPTASYITSYAREMLCGYIAGLRDNFLYCDTDSVFFTEEGHEWLLNNADFGEELGQLSKKDFEIYDKAAFLGKKCYLAQKGDKKKSVIAGIRDYPFETVEEGVESLLKGEVSATLQAIRCQQGVVLADVFKGKVFDDRADKVFSDGNI